MDMITAMTKAGPEQVNAAQERMHALTQQRREEGALTKAILGSMWGNNIDEHVARGLARYCRTHGIDAAEIDVLGGKPYLNAKYYTRRLIEQVGPSAIQYLKSDHIEEDPRLVEMIEEQIPDDADEETKADLLERRRWARREHFRRKQERITHGLSDKAPAAVVCRLKLVGNADEFVGADEAGMKKRKKVKKRNGEGFFEVDADPVGDEHPRKTAETRARRRCLLQVVNTFPALSERLKAEETGLSQVMVEVATEEARTDIGRRAVPQLAGGEAAQDEPYDVSGEDVQEGAAERKSEEDIRNEAARTKAQLWQLDKVLESEVFTEEERKAARDQWENATYGEMESLIADVKDTRGERERAAQPKATAA
jgi:hypothetical protein